jgi:hypothetical protein
MVKWLPTYRIFVPIQHKLQIIFGQPIFFFTNYGTYLFVCRQFWLCFLFVDISFISYGSTRIIIY